MKQRTPETTDFLLQRGEGGGGVVGGEAGFCFEITELKQTPVNFLVRETGCLSN